MPLAIAGVPGVRSKLVGQPLLYAISCFASIGVFLFGYDQGVMSGILTGPYFKAYFNQPSRAKLGTMVAILEVGAFVTSLIAGRLGDAVGRRQTLFIGAFVFVLGGGVQTCATGYSVMVFGRLISGAGVGLLSTIVPIYQSEVSPANHRGKLACMEFTGNVIGYATSVWVDYFCSYLYSDWSWRLPLFVQCVIGTILALGSLLIPESPRWLVDHGEDETGRAVIIDLHGGDPDNAKALQEFKDIRDAVVKERDDLDRSYVAMWRKYKSRVLLACSAQAFAQLNGINVISYYAPLVFEQAGWVGRDAILMTGVNAIIYTLSTIPTWYLVDIWGRRIILMSGAVVMCVALAATGWWMYVDQAITPKAVVVCVVIFNAAFGYSWGPIPWLYPPEIMPLAMRAKGVSLSTATNWFFNFIVGEVTPVLQELVGFRLYLIHAFFCANSLLLVYFRTCLTVISVSNSYFNSSLWGVMLVYPETMGVPLEEMDRVFGEDIDSDSESDDDNERASLVRNSIPPSSYVSPPGSRLASPERTGSRGREVVGYGV